MLDPARRGAPLGAVKRSRFRHGLAVAIVTIASLARGQEAHAPEQAVEASQEAQTWFDEGQAAYTRGEFDVAAALFRAVYVATPTPEILYDLAQAERRAKQCKAALAHYEEYLKLDQAAAPHDVGQKIAEVRTCVENEEAAKPPTAPDKQPAAQAPKTVARKSETHDDGTLRALAYGSIGGAFLTAAVGTVFLIQANDASQNLEALNTAGAKWGDRYASYQSELEHDRNAAIGFFAASGVMAAAATGLLLSSPRASRTQTASMSLGAPGSGLGATYTAHF
jgi:tetratricopeptide (TPR) repeat protein